MSNLANSIIPLNWLNERATTPLRSSEYLSLLSLQSMGLAYSLSPGCCRELLAAVLPQLETSLFENEACKWKTGWKRVSLDDIIYAPASSHANIVQLCEPIKSLCWLMTVEIDLSFLTKKFLLWFIPSNCNVWNQEVLKNKATFWKTTQYQFLKEITF